MPPHSVTIVQSWLSPYRVPFYEHLRSALGAAGVRLNVVYGQPSPTEMTKGATAEMPWGDFVPNRYLQVAGHELSWQPALRRAAASDLVIVEQAVKRVLNWLLVGRRHLRADFKLAFWGHGRNYRSPSTSPAERAKRSLSRQVDWWFAYTGRSAEVVAGLPFDRDRITVVNNSIDTRSLEAAHRRAVARPAAVAERRRRLGVTGGHVALFVGAMYPEKRLDFLVACCDRLRLVIPDFEMVFVGAGVDERIVQDAADSRPWMHHVGPVFGAEVADYFAMASVVLMPGLVGLAVLDSFVCETPMVTTDLPLHSPEIEYLEHGANGIVVSPSDSVDSYVGAVTRLFSDEGLRVALVEGCRRSAQAFSVEAMAENFAAGTMRALATRRAE